MKITKKAGKLVLNATAEELRKNPKLAAAIRKAQGLPPATPTADPAAVSPDLGGSDLGGDVGGSADLPTDGSDLGGPDLGGDDVDPALAGDKGEKFVASVDKAFTEQFGKPMDEGMKQVLKGLAQMADSKPVEDASSTPDTGADLGGDPLSPDAAPADPAMPGAPGHGAPAGGDSNLLALSRGRLTRTASASEFVQKLASRLAK